MQKKPYPTKTFESLQVAEPAVAYQPAQPQNSSADGWDPNVPFHGSQEEWWEHFHRIEEGPFMSLEEYRKDFEAWKRKYHASRMKKESDANR
ncbi:MAG: hypothetical protein LBR06_00435 [Bacteroidales bacterium]|jgi:hypothetical protein|nr:hypothetical protein [Bacteroidales bacterium]